MAQRKQVVRLLASNINERDLSIGLVMLKQYAVADPTVAQQRSLRFVAHGMGYCERIHWTSYMEFLSSIRQMGVFRR